MAHGPTRKLRGLRLLLFCLLQWSRSGPDQTGIENNRVGNRDTVGSPSPRIGVPHSGRPKDDLSRLLSGTSLVPSSVP